MKIIIIHGDSVDSSQKLSFLKSQFNKLQVLQINAKELSPLALKDQFVAQDLFLPSQLIIVENPSESLDLAQLDSQTDNIVVFYFSKSLPARAKILSFPKSLPVQVFSFPKKIAITVWPFLDLVFSKNSQSLKEFEKLMPEYGGQYLLTMIAFGLRRLILPLKAAGGFNEQKILNQRKIFPIDKISYLYKQVLETDFKIKSGLIEEKMALTLLLQKFLIS